MPEKLNQEKGKGTRRFFIAKAAAGTLGLSFLGKTALFSAEEPSQNKKEKGTKKMNKKKKKPEFEPVEDVPGLPRVLLLGDSISIGYTLPTRDLLKGKVNVHRALENCGNTTKGLEKIDEWLGEKQWDVIHFNWGLHDLKYEPGKSPDKGDSQRIPLEQYKKNMEALVAHMKKTGAQLIFATTTPYPEGVTPLRVPEDARIYNEAALALMKQHAVMIDDLYTYALPKLKELQRPANVHFLPEGSKTLAEQVANSILKALEEKSASEKESVSDDQTEQSEEEVSHGKK